VQIRRAGRHDLPGLALLLGQLGYPVAADRLEERLERLDSELFVAAADDEVLGLAAVQVMHVLQREAPVARLTALVVREEARGRGVARRLVETAEAVARHAGCEHLHVTSAEHRRDAHAAYRALGFADTGRRFGKPL
jgi:N-acetylglutamate synthase-like GNAT family acetyltransferase